MKRTKVELDFEKIKTKDELYNFIELNFDLEPIEGGWGRNLDAFWDCYSYSDEVKLLEVLNTGIINNPDFREYIGFFLSLLDDFKTTNPNFDYKILS